MGLGGKETTACQNGYFSFNGLSSRKAPVMIRGGRFHVGGDFVMFYWLSITGVWSTETNAFFSAVIGR